MFEMRLTRYPYPLCFNGTMVWVDVFSRILSARYTQLQGGWVQGSHGSIATDPNVGRALDWIRHTGTQI
jgi:hypothetical protein